MKPTLVRKFYRPDGIFGELYDKLGSFICYTLEHAYQMGEQSWGPKVAVGVYKCIRHAPNRLPYETFELQSVPDFQGVPVVGILIHCGNFDKDSEGCILLGEDIASPGESEMLINSRVAFQKFMAAQKGLDEFELIITSQPADAPLLMGA